MAELSYLLCMLVALTCCIMLLRGHRRSRSPLLFWSGLCFGLLALDNLLLFVDRILLPGVDHSFTFAPVALIAVGLLLYGLIWRTT